MKKAFISGITGQDGAWLASLLIHNGYKIYGGVRNPSKVETWRLDYLNILKKIEFVYFDLNNLTSIEESIKNIQPDEFYNFAAISAVSESFDNPILIMQNVGLSVTKILHSILLHSKETKFFQAGSAEIFANQTGNIYEDSCPKPNSPYGVSKNYAHEMVKMYREVYGIFAVNGIFFSHESELRGENFFTKKIAIHVSKIKKNKLKSILEVGNIESKRDFGYAKEYMTAVILSMSRNEADDYIICTGKKNSLKDYIKYSYSLIDIELIWEGVSENLIGLNNKNNEILIQINKKFYRPSELNDFTGSNEKAEKKINWSPKLDFKKISEIMLNFELNKL